MPLDASFGHLTARNSGAGNVRNVVNRAPSLTLFRPILQLSCFLINIWRLPCALSKNFGTVIVGRFLGGLSTAGGSVTPGMVADMWKPNDQQYAVAFVVLSSLGGATIGPIFGGFLQQYACWRWNFWKQLIFGGFTQIVHLCLVPETRTTIMLYKEAKRRRKEGIDDNINGPNELKEQRMDLKEFLWVSVRPFEMFVREPIVLACRSSVVSRTH